MDIIPKSSFRIIGLSEQELSYLAEKYLQDIEYRNGRNHKNKNEMVLRIPLDEKISVEVLKGIISESPDNIYYDFFISVSSEHQSVVVTIPKMVLNLYQIIGGEISFSYSCTCD